MGQNQTVGRFAPSPSGRMHLGNVFSAALAWLSAKSKGGKMVLRIEDLDTARCKPEYAKQLIDDLTWLGFKWDAGGLVPGYVQSEETAFYETALAEIAKRAQIYPCYCTREELHAADAPHLSDGTVRYTGRCRSLTPQQRAAAGRRSAAIRLAVPNETISFADGHMGVRCENLQTECGDFILRRSDGIFAYQLAVVADDIRMGVTEVVRGCDLLSSTARQIYLYRLLQASPPQFYHIPLLCAEDGRRLSKREKDLDMGALREIYTAPQIVGRIGSFANLVPRGTEITLSELATLFDWEKIPRNHIVVRAQDLK